MEVGLALPPVPGVRGQTVLDWARAGEQAGFSTLATLDRLVWDCYEGLVTLAAAAAVTSRCRLTTAIMISPLRNNTALLAKQAATVDQLSGGRLVLGLAAGMRRDDFAASGVNPATRGKALDAQLDELDRIWSGEPRGMAGPIGPPPVRAGGPEIILGGQSPAAVERAVRRASGWIGGSGNPEMFREGAEMVRSAWAEEGRPGQPRLLALAYFALGDNARQHAEGYLREYYSFAPPLAEMVLGTASVSADQIAEHIAAYRDAGCDELIFTPCSADLHQVELLHDAVSRADQPLAVG
jgi:alkanesulfonate monooxygenase SsuD/methylene tetrahydromethanopterin reductase-like flavin-dependent oxidoreductase (luciferase family)